MLITPIKELLAALTAADFPNEELMRLPASQLQVFYDALLHDSVLWQKRIAPGKTVAASIPEGLATMTATEKAELRERITRNSQG